MGESVEYYLTASGLDAKQRKEWVKLAREFAGKDAETDEVVKDGLPTGEVSLFVGSGRRGGGASCAQIIEGTFGAFAKKHKITIRGYVRYLEQCPRADVWIEEDGKAHELFD